MLSTIFNWIINNLLQSTPIIIGLVVVIGLVAQKKNIRTDNPGIHQVYHWLPDIRDGHRCVLRCHQLYAGYDGPYIRCPGDDAEQRFYKWLW